MAVSLEARSPLLDHRVTQNKRMLKEMMTGRLPDRMIHRPKKGLGMPIAQWLRSESLQIGRDCFLAGAENALRSRPRDDEALKDQEIKRLKQEVGELMLDNLREAAIRSVDPAVLMKELAASDDPADVT